MAEDRKPQIERLAPFRFVKGRSGNPSGRPARLPVSGLYAKLCEMEVPENLRRKLNRGRKSLGLPKNCTFGEALVLRLFLKALAGSELAAKEIRVAIEGHPTRRVESLVVSAEVDSNFYRNKLKTLLGEDGKYLPAASDHPAEPEP